MANKQLTVTINAKTSKFESGLKRITRGIDQMTNKMNNVGNTGLENKLKQNERTTSNIVSKVKSWGTAQRHVTAQAKSTHSVLGSIHSRLGAIASTYLGIMGAKAVGGAADTITSAQNRLNNMSGGNPELTSQTMDKIYAAAQRSRTSYGGMMSDVSKLMTLSGDAFQGNVDNAIRFQEIMAKAYTVGGASAQEMSSSMYQLTQALGSGILQGDELRSVREGAPLAYKQIEKFAQGVFDTQMSLKDLASEGVITSNIIVAAMSDADFTSELERKFENTQMTFAQAATNIKNMALTAFTPVLESLTDMLNSESGQKFLQGIGQALVFLANAISWAFGVISSFFSWFANNWSWLQYIVIGVLGAIIAYLIYYTAVHIGQAVIRIGMWIAEHAAMIGIFGAIALLVGGIVWLANTTGDGCTFMVGAIMLVAVALLIVGIITGNVTMMIGAAILALVALFIAFAEEIVGAIYWAGALIWNIIAGILNFIMGVLSTIVAVVYNAIADIVNFASALWNVIKVICENIGVAFENAWIFAKNCFWDFVASVLSGLQALLTPINALLGLVGLEIDLSSTISSIEGNKQGYKSMTGIGSAWNQGMNTMQRKSYGDAWNSGFNTLGYLNLNTAYNNGAAVGAGIQNAVGSIGDSIKNGINNIDLGSALNGMDGLLDPNDPNFALGSGFDPNAAAEDIANGSKKLNNIDDNTASIKDSMELTAEDLEYLRRLAILEWKKEYTTANVTVDMNNYNTIHDGNDLEGIVTQLSNRLYEELNSLANGSYA